jgi:hypothetical protein
MTHVKNFLKWCLLVGGMIFWFTVIVTIATLAPKERVYDCTISEISPDFPIEVREECRRLRIVERRTEI